MICVTQCHADSYAKPNEISQYQCQWYVHRRFWTVVASDQPLLP